MLETIREYALERLESSSEVEEAQRKHAQYYVELAETARPKLLRSGAGPRHSRGYKKSTTTCERRWDGPYEIWRRRWERGWRWRCGGSGSRVAT